MRYRCYARVTREEGQLYYIHLDLGPPRSISCFLSILPSLIFIGTCITAVSILNSFHFSKKHFGLICQAPIDLLRLKLTPVCT